MIDFTKIIYGILDDHERLAILVHTSTTLDKCTITDAHLPRFSTTLKAIETKLDEAANRERKSPLTDDIHAAHDERLSCTKSIQQGLLYFLEHDDSAMVHAAELIQKSYDMHLKKLPNKKKSTFTRAVGKFLADLETPEATAALELMLMFEKIDQLASAQRLFVGKTTARAESEETEVSPSLRNARAEMHKMMDIVEHHIYFEQYQGNAAYDELVLQLNGRIGEIMTIAKSRHTMESHHDEELSDENGETVENPVDTDNETGETPEE